jgi:hypothetical protein
MLSRLNPTRRDMCCSEIVVVAFCVALASKVASQHNSFRVCFFVKIRFRVLISEAFF